jgi:hypothetical protein
MILRSSKSAYVFKGHTAGWLELPPDVGGCILNEALHNVLDTMCDPRTNIGVEFQFTLDGARLEFEVRLR